MQLSERAAINEAIVEGGFHVYPAGKLVEFVKSRLKDDNLTSDFEPAKTIDKIQGTISSTINQIIRFDLELLCKCLDKINKLYDFDGENAKIVKELPQLAHLYFGLDNFKPVPAKLVEYYFEGYNEMYKDADWRAFNVDETESKWLKVPVGVYYKRSWVTPSRLLWTTAHENIHQMESVLSFPRNMHRNVPWFSEGMAEVVGLIMSYKISKDKDFIVKCKKFITEIDVLDQRKATYNYGIGLVTVLFKTASLAYVRTLLEMHRRYIYDIDLNTLADSIKNSVDLHKIISLLYKGTDNSTFVKEFNGLEKKFTKERELDKEDIEVLNLLSFMHPPAVLPVNEYMAALWFNDQVTKNAHEHMVELEHGQLKPFRDIPEDVRNRTPGFNEKVVILADAIPESLLAGAKELGNKYFVIKRETTGKIVFDPWVGGLPFRFGSGEIRCALEV